LMLSLAVFRSRVIEAPFSIAKSRRNTSKFIEKALPVRF
jgi:hypothetical protein